jgi:predicted small secreted protein
MKKILLYILIGIGTIGLVGGATAVFASDVLPNNMLNTSSETDEDLSNVVTNLTAEQAQQAVLVAYPTATVVSTELEDENGTIVFGVIITVDSTQYDVKVDANTGDVLSEELDDGSEEAGSNDKADTDNNQVEHENENEDSES